MPWTYASGSSQEAKWRNIETTSEFSDHEKINFSCGLKKKLKWPKVGSKSDLIEYKHSFIIHCTILDRGRLENFTAACKMFNVNPSCGK